jgi:hypothetical protein
MSTVVACKLAFISNSQSNRSFTSVICNGVVSTAKSTAVAKSIAVPLCSNLSLLSPETP